MRSIRILIAAGAVALGAAGPAQATTQPNYICPDPEIETLSGGDFAPTNPFDSRDLEGRRTRRARRIAAEHDCSVRVVRRNGEDLFVTEDFSFSRINVAVRHRRVTKVFGVF
jgi:hypothetical protein